MTTATARFSVVDAVAAHLGWDRDEMRDYRYQPTRTPCAVYSVGEEFFTATTGRKPKESNDHFYGCWRWEEVPAAGYAGAMRWRIWRAREDAEC
jgi:hypothetical protein